MTCKRRLARADISCVTPDMKTALLPLLAATALLGACATPAYVSPVEVTRFTGAAPQQLGQGTISVAAAPGLDGDSLAFAAYADAVRSELEAIGYRVVASDGGQVAAIALTSTLADPEERRSPVGVGVGGSTGSYGSGVGVGVGINLNSLAGPPAERIERLLFVAIRPASGGANLWEGRANMTATSNSDFANEQAAAARMVEALFAGFPGVSGETIEVE